MLPSTSPTRRRNAKLNIKRAATLFHRNRLFKKGWKFVGRARNGFIGNVLNRPTLGLDPVTSSPFPTKKQY